MSRCEGTIRLIHYPRREIQVNMTIHKMIHCTGNSVGYKIQLLQLNGLDLLEAPPVLLYQQQMRCILNPVIVIYNEYINKDYKKKKAIY